MTIQEEEDHKLAKRITKAFDRIEEIQKQHPDGNEFVSILRGKATPEQKLHLECCPDCAFKLQHISGAVKKAYLMTFLKERGYR